MLQSADVHETQRSMTVSKRRKALQHMSIYAEAPLKTPFKDCRYTRNTRS
ncbi:hypothetical protein N24_0167 [Corynebacterium suranareeae]|uniref:Uncharacterized protein n=1 Tax=Corynebacterium suranareeae TaxID=2506452 RepID=A0A160PLA4_9CORY|nr:hypothetical protein N24_0167 [Corynebacterium suranareeae]